MTMKIEKARYEGYLWYSDSQLPMVLTGDKDFELDVENRQNPFIVEGQLYSAETSVSLSIRYIDGAYHVYRHEVKPSELQLHADDLVEYRSLRMQGRTLRFWQTWKRETDKACLGMDTLTPSALVFIGFGKTEKAE